MNRYFALFTLLAFSLSSSNTRGADEISPKTAKAALKRSVDFYRTKVATHGAYLWRYSPDLQFREGEGSASNETGWVQPPGTPSVGQAYLTAYQYCGERYLLDAAIETGMALVSTQLRSGGWDYRIEFNPKQRQRYNYLVEQERPDARNVTTLDDDNTQSALRFLVRLDRELKFKNAKIHNCVEYALSQLLKAQYPNGAWPQRFSAPPDPKDFPVKKARYPEKWTRTYPKLDYRSYYTFNDDTIADMIDTMLDAADIYGEPRYRAAALKAGDFIIMAQMPDPQPAWAQQYNANMEPAWARRFEPPAVTGGESQGVMRTLINLHRRTGEKKYLEPVPKALAYLNKSKRPDGRLVRFYELKTNTPLYFTKDYKLTYSDADMPTHYGFIVGSSLDRIERSFQQALARKEFESSVPRAQPSRRGKSITNAAQSVINAMDERGVWLKDEHFRSRNLPNDEQPLILMDVYARNIVTLARYVGAK